MHLNIVTSAALWRLGNNRNNLVFNRKTWINMKHVWSLVLSYLRSWKVAYTEQEGEFFSVNGKPDSKAPKPSPPRCGVKKSCKDFLWVTSWLTTAGSACGGRATLSYLQEHPEESNNIHVVMWFKVTMPLFHHDEKEAEVMSSRKSLQSLEDRLVVPMVGVSSASSCL